MKKISFYQLFYFYFLFGFYLEIQAQSDTSFSLQYLTDTLVLSDHPLSSQFRLKHNSLYVSRKSKELAATFDDPSRVLYRHVGISTANDQANGIVYHGLPSDFTKWTIHGAEIVNPNHTSNAGTFSDNSSLSSGGVLGIPFDVIKSFSFHANTHVENTPTTVGGIANFNFLSESENFFKIGLLGLELATQTKKSSIPVKTHFRYSTVGLLGQLGVDFGGEKIAFSDGFVQVRLMPKLELISGGGFSSNIFRGVENPEEAIIEKELKDIDFNSYFFYTGLVFDNKRDKHALMYSQKKDTRVSKSDFLNSSTDSQFENIKISYAGQIPLFKNEINNFDLLINGSASNVAHNFPMSRSDDWRSYLHFALRYTWFNDNYSFTGKMGPKLEFTTREVTPELSFIASRQFNNQSVELGTSLSSQEQAANIYGFIPLTGIIEDHLLSNKSLNTSISYKAEIRKNQKSLIRLFYQYLYDLPASFIGYSPIFNAPTNSQINSLKNWGDATNYGIELMFDQLFNNGFYINTNLTLFEFTNGLTKESFSLGAVELLKEDLSVTNNFNYLFNFNTSKSWSLKKNKNISINFAFHLRGGAYDYFDIEKPIRLRPYSRFDMRIQYDFKKSIIALDIQNLTNRKNDAFYVYDKLLESQVLQQQLGLIPVLSWKRVI